MIKLSPDHKYVVTASDLGGLLKALRQQRGYTLSGAAKVAGISKGYLWQLERGDVNLSMQVLVKLANAYQIAPSEVIFMTEEVVDGRGNRVPG